jgi:hypothetical protein
MDEQKREELRDQAWKYFALHADQRLKAFNFYLILCTVIAGGLLTLIKDARDPRIAILVALLLPSLSLVFWKLDTRNRQLIDHSQEALMFFEDDPRLKRLSAHLTLLSYSSSRRTSLVRSRGRIADASTQCS